ncbi:MAG: tetratricopeptide repeat protein [Aquificaceae bacterium]
MIRVVFIFLISLLFSCAVQQEDTNRAKWQYFYDLGMSSYVAKNYSEAIANLFKASQLAPREPKVWSALGLAYMEAREYEKAERSFLKALEVDKSYTEARLNLGILYYRTANYQKALESLKSATKDEAFPQKHMAFYYLAKTYQAIDNQKEYKRNLLKAVSYNPMFLEAQLELAQVYEVEGNYQSAQSVYQSLINNDIRDPAIELSLARVEYKLKNYAAAKDHIRNVIEDKRIDPQLKAQAYELLSLILIDEQKLQTQKISEEKEVKAEIRGETTKEKVEKVEGVKPQTSQTISIQDRQNKEEGSRKSFYRIQLGAFSSMESAESWKNRLEKDFRLSGIVIVERAGIYRVFYGNFDDLKEANRELKRLRSLNVYGFIVSGE